MRVLFILLINLLAVPSWAEVYKQVDENGNVIYTDIPKKKSEQPHKVAPITTFESKKAAPRYKEGSSRRKATKNKEQGPSSYTVAISTPQDNQSVRADDGKVTLQASVEPSLASNHELIFLVDGAEVAKGSSTQTVLENLDRGSHSVQVQITANQQVISSSDTVTFYLQRGTVYDANHSGRKMAPKAKAAPKARMAN